MFTEFETSLSTAYTDRAQALTANLRTCLMVQGYDNGKIDG